MVGLKYNLDFPVDSQMETFYISIKFIVVLHVNMLQQLHLPVNSIIPKHERNQLKLFNLFNIANNIIKSTSKLKKKLDWYLELIYVKYKWNPGIISSFL